MKTPETESHQDWPTLQFEDHAAFNGSIGNKFDPEDPETIEYRVSYSEESSPAHRRDCASTLLTHVIGRLVEGGEIATAYRHVRSCRTKNTRTNNVSKKDKFQEIHTRAIIHQSQRALRLHPTEP